jgi:hypothetical protein
LATLFEVVGEGARASTPIADDDSALIDEWGGRTVTGAEAQFLARLSLVRTDDGLSGLSAIDGGEDGQAVDGLRLPQEGFLDRIVVRQVDDEKLDNQDSPNSSDHESRSSISSQSPNRTRSTGGHSSRSSNSRRRCLSSSSASSNDSMARPHFEKPPTFRGLEGDDPIEWVERYEEAAAINNWNDAAKAANMIRSLEGPARKWYLNITRPLHSHTSVRRHCR